jgi:FAD dependent oxidoreductase TIGR03364
MTPRYDVAVIGGGIVGLAHAWMAAQRRQRVLLLERSAVAEGASVRNFGMIWPIGQPAGELHALALRSRDLWLQLHALGAVDVEECGSVHLAHRPDELSVLEEFCGLGQHQSRMLLPEEVLRLTPLANPEGLLGGMLSRSELRVDPRTASARIAVWLSASQGVECCFNTFVTSVHVGHIRAADGREWQADQIILCSGSDLQTLYPEVLQHSGLKLCKLQMLKTVAQPAARPDTPHIASGLTLRHYAAFANCPSLPAFRSRVARETPELDRYGIHVMASQFPGGEVILGDSHQYGDDITPFDNSQIDELILRQLHKVIRFSDWTIAERWHGIYAKHPALPVFESETDDGVQIFVGTGGAGMTMSFGLADRAWKRWMGENS